MVKSKRARDVVEAEETPVIEKIDEPAKKRKRSDDEPASGDVKKKAKKDKKKHEKESRKEKKDKRKDLLDLPEEEKEGDADETAEAEKMDVDATPAEEAKKEKKEKKDKKKEKKEKKKSEGDEDEEKKKEKKEKKDKKKKKSKTDESQETDNAAEPKGDEETANGEDDGKADRHIVFVGNLPYSATAASITAHFASLSPVSVRCLTKREDPTACRGIAFVEFGKVWHMRTCLDKFHHSMFDDGVSPARRINVELTAGGGGKTKQRSDKIKEKNRKLDENRAKRIEREKTAKEENKNGAAKQQDSQDYIHPSRRARLPGQKW